MNANKQPPAILIGMDRLLGLQLARILWRRGVPVIGTALNPNRPHCRTRAAKKVISHTNIAENPVPWIQQIAQEHGGLRPVIIPCADDFAWWMTRHRDELSETADFLIPPPETLELLADKSRFYRYATENGLPLPATRFAQTPNELEEAARAMSFPLLVKPPIKTVEWMAVTNDFKVLKIDTAEDLMDIGPHLLTTVGELILQEWVPGPDANMHSLYILLDRNSQPLISSVVAKKLRQWPPDVGVGCLAVQVDVEEVVNTGIGILQKLNYAGPGSFQFKQDEISGQFYMIEMNTRSPLNFPLCEACGIEATYTGYCAAAGLPLPQNRTVTHPGAKWICWTTDLPSAYTHWKRGDLTIGQWLKSLRGRKWQADAQLSDPAPMLAGLVRKVTHGVSLRSIQTLFNRK